MYKEEANTESPFTFVPSVQGTSNPSVSMYTSQPAIPVDCGQIGLHTLSASLSRLSTTLTPVDPSKSGVYTKVHLIICQYTFG